MKIKDEELKKIINDYRNKIENEGEIWKYANNKLYDMCIEEPLHEDVDIVAGKLLLIGRTYSVAIERRKNKSEDGLENDEFYYKKVAPRIIKYFVEKNLDNRIENLKYDKGTVEENVELVLKIHSELVEVFNELTEMDKRSLASKYLHFHCPEKFFIYDSRAKSAIDKIVDKTGEYNVQYDLEYSKFVYKCIKLQEFIIYKFAYNCKPRELDNFLLYYYNECRG